MDDGPDTGNRNDPTTDLIYVKCPKGHTFGVGKYVWDNFHSHGCGECKKSYMVHDLQVVQCNGLPMID